MRLIVEHVGTGPRGLLDELAEDVRQHVFQLLDNDICIQGEVAAAIEHAFRRES